MADEDRRSKYMETFFCNFYTLKLEFHEDAVKVIFLNQEVTLTNGTKFHLVPFENHAVIRDSMVSLAPRGFRASREMSEKSPISPVN